MVMNSKRKSLKAKIGAALLLLPLILSGMLAGEQLVGAASSQETIKQVVHLHKTKFENQLPELKENSGQVDPDFGGEPLEGAVFTVYDITEQYWQAYDEATGTDGSEKQMAATEAILATPAPTSDGLKVGPTDSDGVAEVSLPIEKDGKDAVYRFVETEHPAGVLVGSSDDFLLGLPVYDETTGEMLEIVHVYPKNLIKTNALGLIKYGVEAAGEVSVLQGAEFYIIGPNDKIYDKESGAFDLTLGATIPASAIFTSDTEGIVKLPELLLDPGDYTFMEIDSEVATGPGADPAAVYHYKNAAAVVATVNDQMEVTYHYYDINGNEAAGETAKAYNYQVPTVEKTADDETVDRGQTVTYTISSLIPTDIGNYSKYRFVDTFSTSLQVVSTEEEVKNTIRFDTVTDSDIATEYAIREGNFTLAFSNPKQLQKYAGKLLTFSVSMKVVGDETGEIKNEIVFENDFVNQTDQMTIETKGKAFIKKDAYTDIELAGARFVLKDEAGNFLQLLDGNGNPVTEVTGIAKGLDVAWVTESDAATSLISATDGTFGVIGLSGDGTYQLVETKAPEAYIINKDAVEIEADNGEEAQTILNKPKGTLPSTGGIGIGGFVIVGALVVAGVALFYFRRREEA